MNEWNTYRVKDVAKFISEKANDCSLPYIALDNIVSWDGYYRGCVKMHTLFFL